MDRDFLRELFAAFGPIEIRPMFGGSSLSADGVTFGLVSRDQIYFKADPESASRFEAEDCVRFQYQAKGKDVTLTPYWRMPERLYDEPDEAAQWARTAFEAARRALAKKPKMKKRSK